MAVVKAKLMPGELVSGGHCGYSIREYDTCRTSFAIVARTLQIEEAELLKPFRIFKRNNLGKNSISHVYHRAYAERNDDDGFRTTEKEYQDACLSVA